MCFARPRRFRRTAFHSRRGGSRWLSVATRRRDTAREPISGSFKPRSQLDGARRGPAPPRTGRGSERSRETFVFVIFGQRDEKAPRGDLWKRTTTAGTQRAARSRRDEQVQGGRKCGAFRRQDGTRRRGGVRQGTSNDRPATTGGPSLDRNAVRHLTRPKTSVPTTSPTPRLTDPDASPDDRRDAPPRPAASRVVPLSVPRTTTRLSRWWFDVGRCSGRK